MEKQDKKSALPDFYNIKEKPKNTHQGIVLFLHHVMLAQGFRLIGISEKEDPVEYKDGLPTEWNKSEESYTFKYKHSQSSLIYLIKMIPLSSNLIVSATCLEDPKPILMELKCTDYVGGESLDVLKEYFKDLEKLEKMFVEKVIQNLFYKKKDDSTQKVDDRQQQQERFDRRDFNERDLTDPLRIGPIRSPNQIFPTRGDFGDSDLYPSFPNVMGPRLGGGNRGNQMGPNDPMFQQRFRPGQMRYPPNVPQGARFDPYGPTPNTNTQEPEPDHYQMPNQPRRDQRRDDDDMFL
jgi:hypothetical protein